MEFTEQWEEIVNLKADLTDTGKRIDSWITEKTQFTRNAVQKLIETEHINVNGSPVKSNYKLRQNDSIDINIPIPSAVDIKPENIPLEILYEDSGMLVINKPRGMVVHPAPGHHSGTLVNALMYHFNGSLSGINGQLRPGIVHRLDKDTTGLLAIAKNDCYHQSLSSQLQSRQMSRKYTAIVLGAIKEDDGTIDKPIGRHPVERKKMAVVSLENGRNAITHFIVFERFLRFTVVQAKLETGRTHQIRVHFAHIGHPVLGDQLYGYKNQSFQNLQGQMLHAEELGFTHPKTGEYIRITAPLPDDFLNLLSKLRKSNILT